MAEWIVKERTSPLGYQYLDVVHRQELIRCKECHYAKKHCTDSVFGKPLYDCRHPSQIGRDGPSHPEDWYCADGERM